MQPSPLRARSRAHRTHALTLALCASLLLAGCASTNPDPPFREMADMVSARGLPSPVWQKDKTAAPPQPLELSLQDVVRLALAHNALVQASLEELGLAAAARAQVSRLQNPGLHASVRSPDGDASGTNVELGLAQNLLQILTLRSRNTLARGELQEAQLRTAQAVLEQAEGAELAYFGAVAAEQQVLLRQTILDAAEATYELARRYYDAGNINELQLRREQKLLEMARIHRMEADKSRAMAQRHLRDVLGGWSLADGSWTVSAQLPAVPAEEPTLAALEERAAEERFDIRAQLREVANLETALGITRRWRLLGGLQIEASAERETDGEWVVGPGIDLELPIFDQGQARVAHAEAALRQARSRLEAMVAMAKSEVIQLREALHAERRIARHYLETIIPMQERTVLLAQEQYNYMLAGIFEVLESRQDEYEAYESYIDSVRDYWQARSRLRYAVGGRLPEMALSPDLTVTPASTAASDIPAGSAAEDMDHSHHEHGAREAPAEDQHEHHDNAPSPGTAQRPSEDSP